MDRNKQVLLVDDDQIDAMTVKRAFKDLKIRNPLDIATDGEDALTYLKQHSDRTPCIILLDLNMPKMNGIEFLRAIKSNERFKTIPVVVLTTSQEDQDCLESYRLGIAGYMLKPMDYSHFIHMVKTIDQYWTLSKFPH